MTNIQKLKKIHNEYGVSYSYVAKNIGIYRQNLYKALVDEDNKNYRTLSKEQNDKLTQFLKKYNF